ncbi:hypothetical protein G9A89_012522 [Geosiphon pyriformis]|nr:hypothetical protein G9A89_012522 [Geosiphon pyriformis]
MIRDQENPKRLITNPELLTRFKNFAFIAKKAYCLSKNLGHSENPVYAYSFRGKKKNQVIAYFRGKEREFDQWRYIIHHQKPYLEVPGAMIKSEFMDAFKIAKKKILKRIRRLLDSRPRSSLHLTGHGVGGVYAVLTGLILQLERRRLKIEIYTYGQPRIGNLEFARHVESEIPKLYRITNTYDYVPQVPLKTAGYMHHETEYWITSHNCECDTPVGSQFSEYLIYECPGKMSSHYKFLDESSVCNNSEVEYGFQGISSHYGPYFGYQMGLCSV